MMLSIIIPTLNEAASLPGALSWTRRATRGRGVEILISDCASRDGTVAIASQAGVDRVVLGARCRADALNRGAARARGLALLFLHADSLLPDGFDELVRRCLTRRNIVGGAFDFSFGRLSGYPTWERCCLDTVIICNRIRFRWTGNFYGDQSIFVRRDVFDRIGGFPCVELMEDLYFSRRLRRAGRTAILRPAVSTSPRRFLARGVIRQFAEDLALLGLDSLGLEPKRLWSRYNALNRTGHACSHPGPDKLPCERASALPRQSGVIHVDG